MAILINFFDNVILQAISEEIVPKVSFFKDRYFPTGAGDIFKANEVLTEYRSGDRKLAAFVDQKAGDIPIGRRSYEVHSYKPAYIAPSRLLTLDELTKRGFGEALYPGMDEAQRAARLLADDMNDMENRIARREEWMAAETMIGNGCVMQEYIDGATKGDSLVVKFYDGTSDHTYTASKKWNENGGDFWGDVKAMCRMLSARGLPAKDLILGTDVADYILTDERTRQLLDKNSGIIVGEIRQQLTQYDGVVFMGTLNFGGFMLNVFSVDETYEDETGKSARYFPATAAMVTAPDCGHMQKDAPAALKSLFTAIGTQPKDKQVGYLKTLLGQWAIESGAKLTGNLDLFVKTLDDVGDASKYNGSMYKEFMLKCETSESVLTMLGSAWRAVRIEVGNNFLPVLKDVAGFGIEKLNDLRAALPDIAERVRQVIEYLLNNGDKVATTIAGIGTAWAGMRFAPQILQVVSSATKFASGAASPVGLVQKGVSGAGKAGNLWQAAKLGTQLANSAVPAGSNPSFGQRVQNTILGSVLGMQNSKKLFGAKTPAGMAKATSALFGSIQQAQASGGIIGLLKGSSIGQYGARVARSAKNLAGTDFIQNTVGVGRWLGQKVTGTQLGGFVGNMGQKAMGFGQGLLGGAKNIAGTAIGGVKNLAGRAASTKVGQFALNVGGGIAKGTGDAFKFLGSGLSLANTAVGPIAGKLGGAFMGLLGTFGPVITGIGGIIAVVSLLGDHLEDIRQIVGNVFGEKGLAMFDGFTSKIHDIAGNVRDSASNAFSLENLQNIQQSLSGKSIFGIDDLGTTFGAVIPIIESVKGLIGQIVDLGVNHIKPLLADIMSFAVNELFPAVSPLISMIISLVGTTLINAIKLVVDVIHGLLPVIEPVIQGIVGLIKGIVSVTITVVNAIIGTLNKVSFTVPDWVPALGGKKFGFNLKEVAMPAFANGGFTHGVSIAGEAGTEAVISFKPSVHDSNVENWVRAGRMLGVSGEDATRAAGVRYFANGGFTDGSKEKLDNLIDFSKAYGKYALRSNGIRTTGDALSMLWTVANNSMSGDASLALAATSIAADVAPLLLNKYLGSDSPVTTALTEAAKNYNGGTVLSSWQDGVLTDTGTPLYVLPPRDTGRTLSEIPVSAYQNTPAPGGNGGSSPQFVFAPNITITGDADRQQIASIMEDEYEKFKAFMDKYNRENNRTRYA